MAKDYNKIAREIIDNIGDKDNVEGVVHCMTRLRFNLKDTRKANTEAISKIDGVTGVVKQGGQYQVVIGTDVAKVYTAMQEQAHFPSELASDSNQSEEKEGIINKVLGTITAIFQPIIPAIAGSGMIKAVLALLVAANWLATDSQTYSLLTIFSDSVFYFLPLLLAYSSAVRFKANAYVSVAIVGILVNPSFTALLGIEGGLAFLNLPVRAITYTSSVIPAILIVLFQSYVEKFISKWVHNSIKMFTVPLVSILITAPVAIILLGPLGSYFGDILYAVFNFFDVHAPWLLPVLMGTLAPLLVMTGMHYSLVPIALVQLSTFGYGTFLNPGMLVSNIASGAAALVVFLKSKTSSMKQISGSGAVTALLGITEPALYGVSLKLKTPLYATMVGGFFGGLWMGIHGVRNYSSAASGLLAWPVYISSDFSNVLNAVIAMAIAFVASGITMWFLGFKEEETVGNDSVQKDNEAEVYSALNKKTEITSPISGRVVSLTEVPDEVFSKGIMGKGVAILPASSHVVAPLDGEVTALFPTKHAIGITGDNGIEVLIHVGIDTVKLDGKGFTAHVKQGQHVSKGDALLDVDFDMLRDLGYEIITPVIISNTGQFVDVIETIDIDGDTDTKILTVFQ